MAFAPPARILFAIGVVGLSFGVGAAATGQEAPPALGKAYIEQVPRNLLPRPAPAPRPSPPPVAQPEPQAPAALPLKAEAPPPAILSACRIRLGSFGDLSNARNLAGDVKPLGEVLQADVTLNGRSMHMVTLAGFHTRKEAEAALVQLKTSKAHLGPLHISGCPN